MMLDLDRLVEASQFCIEHGCNQSICSGKQSGSGYDNDTWSVGVNVKMKKDDKDKDEDNEDEDHDNDNDVDLWGSGGATQWGKDEDDYDGWGVDKWKWSKDPTTTGIISEGSCKGINACIGTTGE